jgi:hypothetical protein
MGGYCAVLRAPYSKFVNYEGTQFPESHELQTEYLSKIYGWDILRSQDRKDHSYLY